MKTIDIFYVVLSIVSIIITKMIIPLIKSKVSKSKIDKTMIIVKTFVDAAEQIFPKKGQGDLRKKYVLEKLRERNVIIAEDMLDAMIEASVLEINKWKKEIEAQPTINVVSKA